MPATDFSDVGKPVNLERAYNLVYSLINFYVKHNIPEKLWNERKLKRVYNTNHSIIIIYLRVQNIFSESLKDQILQKS